MRRLTFLASILILLSLACSLTGTTPNASATETATAEQMMTQLPATEKAATPTPGGFPPPTQSAGTPAGDFPTPRFNPFQNMTDEQAACLKEAWGEEGFQAITGFQRPPTSQEEQAFATCNLPMPSGGPGQAAGPGQPGGGTPGGPNQPGGPDQAGGPFNDETYYAVSSDGLTWSKGTLLAEHASVPDVIYTSQGVYWAYWVDFSAVTGPHPEKIGVARSTDGVNWQKLGDAVFEGLGNRVPVDPTVVELPDGRLRMYFFDIAQFQGVHSIYSAISSDGIHFTVEEGTRFELENITDPDVILLPDGRYRMYLSVGSTTLSAISTNGLDFTYEDGQRVSEGGVAGAIVLSDGSIRLYACVHGGISAYKSADGLLFTLEKKDVVTVAGSGFICDPSVAVTPNGYLMIYKFRQGQ